MKPKYTSIRDQRAAWVNLARSFLRRALEEREKGEAIQAKRKNDLAKLILDQAASGDPYEVISVEFESNVAASLKRVYAFPFDREETSPDLRAEVERLKQLMAKGEIS